jgi:hypothetical protein
MGSKRLGGSLDPIENCCCVSFADGRKMQEHHYISERCNATNEE